MAAGNTHKKFSLNSIIVPLSFSILFFGFNCNLFAQNWLPANVFLTKAYKKYHIIGLDEGPHGTIQGHAFLRSLINDKQVSRTIDYIILEFASSTQQATVDQFVNGGDVSDSDLKKIWRTGTQAHNSGYGEAPVFLKLLESIRSLNKKNSHKIRVIAGDPGLDWNKIDNFKSYIGSLGQRDLYPAHQAIHYGIELKKNVLLIYGGGHFNKFNKNNNLNKDLKQDSTHWSIDYFVNSKYPGSMMTIGVTDKLPSGAATGKNRFMAFVNQNGTNDFKNDAIWYMSDLSTWVEDKPAFIEEPYWDELNRRSLLVWREGIDSTLKKK